MRTSSIHAFSALTVLSVAACGGEIQTADELNEQLRNAPPTSTAPPTQGQPQPGEQPQPGVQPQPGEQPQPGNSPGGADIPVVDLAPSDQPSDGDPSMPASGNGDGLGMGGSGGAAPPPAGPFTPRSGSFKMLVYSRTTGFRHDSIAQGKTMLREIASEQGFEIVETEVNDLITPDGLAQFEIVFFMNSTGDIFNQAEEAAFQQWMETKNGAFAGVHSATDTEQGWAFYKELTGQYYDGHVNANTPGAIQFEADALEFPAVQGVPNPWQRNEEWYQFNSFQEWTIKPGFTVLGRKAADNQPIVWIRELNTWRSFYSAIGHDAAVFRDPAVKQHLTGGIMWAVRRDQLLAQ
jgi:type 1 glutamine amidotransferase